MAHANIWQTMNRFRSILAALFPYRAHLEAEIEYLREQVAQKQRRIDILLDAVVKAAAPKAVIPREPPAPIKSVQPRGWDEVRAARKANPVEETDAVQS
jgi:hypothetical protein